jgi:hypothetical protein
MQRKTHMQDQVANKVEDIMRHYQKRNAVDGLRRLLRRIRKTALAA